MTGPPPGCPVPDPTPFPDTPPHPAGRYLTWAVLLGVGGLLGAGGTLLGLSLSQSARSAPGLLLTDFQPEPFLRPIREAHGLTAAEIRASDDSRFELYGPGNRWGSPRAWAQRRTIEFQGKLPAQQGAQVCEAIARELQSELKRLGLSQTRVSGTSGFTGVDYDTVHEFHYTNQTGRTGYGRFTGASRGTELRATLLLFEDR